MQTMKISGRKSATRPAAVGSPFRVTEVAKRSGTEQVERRESPATDVELSESTREVAHASELLAELPDVRVDRIEEIRPRIEDGSYKVESRVVAKRLVDAALRESVLQRKPRR
jgi:negative regulator of flagellin synthesis FlgM